jgi:hypothetical protein
MSRLLVAGLPRSGTSWVGQVLACADGARSVGEPDNEDNFPYAIRAKAGLGRLPVVPADGPVPPAYEALWQGAFAGGGAWPGVRAPASLALHAAAKRHRSVHGSVGWSRGHRAALAAAVRLSSPGRRVAASHVVVKTVFAPFALEWICRRFEPELVVTIRGPLNTVASWQRLGWDPPLWQHPGLADGGPDAFARRLLSPQTARDLPAAPSEHDRIRRLTWELCLLMAAVLDVRASRPESVLVRHEDMCVDPVEKFRALYDRLGLRWTDAAEAFLRSSNRPGTGRYDTARVASEEADRWRSRLDLEAAREVEEVVASFGLDW